MTRYSLVHLIGSDEIIQVPHTTNGSPPSTPIKRACLHRFPGAELEDLSRLKLQQTSGHPYRSVLGTGTAMRMLRDQSQTTTERLSKLEKDVQLNKTETASMREKLKETNQRLAKTEKVSRDTSRELLDFQRSSALDARPIVYFGALCYLNSMIVGKASGITDESSTHIAKLVNFVKHKTGLIRTNDTVKKHVTKENVDSFTSGIDVKLRHHSAHPNMEPDILLKKLFLIRRAAFERGEMKALGEVHVALQMTLAVTGPIKARKLLDTWKAEGSTGWARFVETDLSPYDDLVN